MPVLWGPSAASDFRLIRPRPSQDPSLPFQSLMTAVPDITNTEQWVTKTTLRERYGRDWEFQLADADIRLHPAHRELASCPVIVWQSDDGCTFVIFKASECTYRCQFFCKPYKQLGTGTDEYDDLAECAVAVLQAQADYAVEQRGDLPGPGVRVARRGCRRFAAPSRSTQGTTSISR